MDIATEQIGAAKAVYTAVLSLCAVMDFG